MASQFFKKAAANSVLGLQISESLVELPETDHCLVTALDVAYSLANMAIPTLHFGYYITMPF